MPNVEEAGVVELIDAAYDMEADEQLWLERVLGALMTIAGSGSAAFFLLQTSYRADGSFRQRLCGDVAFVGPDPVWSPATIDAINGAPFAETMFGRTQATTVSQATGLGARVPDLPIWRDCWREPVVDSLGLVARGTDGHGFCACADWCRLLLCRRARRGC